MELNEFVKYAAAGALITTVGSLFALFIKDFFLIKYFENRKEKKSVDDIYKRYKDPITLSSIELSSRLLEILQDYPTVFLSHNVLKLKTTTLIKNSTDDEHFRKHKLLSTIYRLCAFMGWLELYRQEITFLNGSNNEINRKLQQCLLNVRAAFADGQLNEEDDWLEWKDFLIFREEQRAIGENMIITADKSKTIMGYGKFKVLIEEFISNGKNDWLTSPINFFLDLKLEKDFRKKRYLLLITHFRDFLATLDKKQSEESIKKINDYIGKN